MTSFGFNIFFGGLAAWFGRAANIIAGIFLMPVLFRHLPREDLGVWLLLGQTWAALGIFDFGLGTILTRRIAFVIGADSITSTHSLSSEQRQALADLVVTSRRLYRWLGWLAFCFSFAGGFVYLHELQTYTQSAGTIWIAWGLLCLSQALGMWAAVWTCALQGLGYVGWDSIIASLVSSLTLVVQIATLLCGGRVLSLAIVAATGALAQRFTIVCFVKSKTRGLPFGSGKWRTGLCREMVGPALRAWTTSLGYLLLANTDQFFIAAHRGTGAIPAYRAAFLLAINLHLIAGVFSGASPVFVSRLWRAGDLPAIRCILRRNARIGLLTMACGAGAILALGPTLFELWLGPGNFIGRPILAIFLLTFALEHHANVFSTCGRATNDEAYALSSLGTGALKVALAWWLTTRFGLAGLACSTLLAQTAINNWFMVYRSSLRLHVRFLNHFKQVLLPVGGLFLCALCVGLAVQSYRIQSPVMCVGLVTLLTTLLLAGALWALALEPCHRDRMLRRLGVV